ncbi:hypothetical protein ACRXCV_08475 [Halobacteriovorax sp. GFR7]|uniref:hypothetical protein n=1 Tax=unclassified Halobacteriovorax TaxID=2639665 RepID=UPI003D991BD1
MFKNKIIFFITLLCLQGLSLAQEGMVGADDDLNIGGDIFSDFNEDLEESQIYEDERYYKYGRFFSFSMAIGYTTWSGNRGMLYEDLPPTFGLTIQYFSDFQSAWNIGFAYSKHNITLTYPTQGIQQFPTSVDISMLRFYFGYRYYIDTSNLGTAITYSNPYLTARFEYWYEQEKITNQDGEVEDSYGGVGIALGGGLEFPIKIKESYVNVEALVHSVALQDVRTIKYAPATKGGPGVSDLTGFAFTLMVGYVWNW